MRLKLDENLGKRGIELLRQAGHDAATVSEQDLCGTADRHLIEICKEESRALVTMDMGFGNPLIFKPLDYFGIVILRLPQRPSHDDFINAIRTLIGGLAKETVAGRLWIIQKSLIRAYQPEE